MVIFTNKTIFLVNIFLILLLKDLFPYPTKYNNIHTKSIAK